MNTTMLISAAFLAGVFGSGHCLGMCGPVIVLLEKQPSGGERRKQVARRILYNLGRLSFYVLLGLVAGTSGAVLTKMAGVEVALNILRVLASLLVVILGLNLLLNRQLLTFLEKGGALLWKRLSPLAKHVLPITSPARAVGAGLVWGALPCGLVYSAVAIAATSGDAVNGAMVMLAFWSGTLPALLLAGASAGTLSACMGRPALRRFAGALLVIVGAVALLMPLIHGGDPQNGDHRHVSVETENAKLVRVESTTVP